MGDILSGIFLILGSVFIVIGGIGILNLPDLICRAHALTKALTLGILLILLGLFFHFDDWLIRVKILLAIFFQFLTIPLSGHIFALLAYRRKKRG